MAFSSGGVVGATLRSSVCGLLMMVTLFDEHRLYAALVAACGLNKLWFLGSRAVGSIDVAHWLRGLRTVGSSRTQIEPMSLTQADSLPLSY